MDDIQLLEAIERYLAGDMSTQEMAQFESIRKKTPEIDQMVVEHEMFLHQMEQYAKRKNFAQLSKQTFDQLQQAGEWNAIDENTTKGKVIILWNKYKKVTAIAASVGGFIALFTSSMIMYFSPSLNGSQVLQLSKAIEVIKKNQKVQGHLLNEVKTKFIYADKGLDLALLQINDEEFKQPKQLPFTIRKKKSDLGEEIFSLGYPRTDNDIVYGKGYLSAQSGFEGDSNAYQIQISANPGYSGAPVFNDNAELIGIISTRQKQAEGVAFAIKSKKIYDLVNTIKENESTKDVKIKLAKASSKLGKDRKSHISNFKNYIYSIKSYN